MRRRYAGALVAMLIVALAGCSNPPTPTAPSPVNITVSCVGGSCNTASPTQPGASPAPGTVTPGVLDHVEVHQFGENCPNGSGPADWKIGDSPHVHVGCTAVITCSPLDSAGKDIPNPPTPDFFGLIGGNAQVQVNAAGNEPRFNRDVFAKTPGTATFACTVAGKGSGAWNMAVQ